MLGGSVCKALGLQGRIVRVVVVVPHMVVVVGLVKLRAELGHMIQVAVVFVGGVCNQPEIVRIEPGVRMERKVRKIGTEPVFVPVLKQAVEVARMSGYFSVEC